MRILTCFVLSVWLLCASSNVVKDSIGGLLEELEAIERELNEHGLSEVVDGVAAPSTRNSHNVRESNEQRQALSRIQIMTEELKGISSTMVELLKENNAMLKSLLPKPEPQPETLNEVINIADPELSAYGRFPYIMDPMILLWDANSFPEALNIHLEGEFVMEENLGVRIGWTNRQATDFVRDNLVYTLHLRWNGHHTVYADETFNRKISNDYRIGGSWGRRPVETVNWPFTGFEPFKLDIIYKDGCFTTRIHSATNNVEIPMCQFPEGRGNLYFSLNSDKEYEVPVRLSKIYVSLKETIEMEMQHGD